MKPQGKVLGGMLLIAGSCIGAGMLALPILTGLAGFVPSCFLLVIAWAFMTYTGLLLVEVNGWFSRQINFLSMTHEALGAKGSWTAWVSYLFLFYSLLVAYMAASGSVFSAIMESVFGLSLSATSATLFFTATFGFIVYLGTRAVDLLNRVLMVGLILSYLGIVAIGLIHIDPKLLTHFSANHMLMPLPILVVSFGFQNMIPSLTAYLNRDLKQVKQTILGGSLITLAIYLVWTLLVLGNLPQEALESSFVKGQEATSALQSALGSSSVVHFAQSFAFFAIITSFLAQGLTLTHFLADGLKRAPTKKNLRWLCLLSLLPPLMLSLYNPQIFYSALGFAGGICAMVLFGILPPLMAWIGRYERKHVSSYHVRGGKSALILTLCMAVFVICRELMRLV